MRGGRSILVVVPARGGSKGVPLKNLKPVAGTPLVSRVGELVSKLSWVDRAVVSTDHEEIARVAEASGIAAPFMRPESLSGDRIGDLEVLTHALEATEEMDGRQYDVVVMLQPTSPLRTAQHVTDTVDKLVAGDFDSVWTLSPTDLKYHPRKQLMLSGDHMEFWDPDGHKIIARQQLTPTLHRNGCAYAIARECLLSQKSIKGKNASAVILEEPMVSIDTLEDFERVEEVLRERRER